MKRGLSITLGTIALAFVANTAFANAPIFSRINDVVIGDRDDQTMGLTVDTNFFRYENAFNVLDYVTDETTTKLRFSFMEGTTHENVSISGDHQLSSKGLNPEADHLTWRADTDVELTDGGTDYWFSFRDLLRSPDDRAIADPIPPLTEAQALDLRFPDPLDPLGNPVTSGTVAALAWQNTDGADTLGSDGDPFGETEFKRLIVLVGSDQSTVSYQSFFVWSVNDVYDTLSGGFTTLFSDDFLGAMQWEYYNAVPFYPAAASNSGSGFLSLIAPGTDGAYGGWGSIALPDPFSTGVVGPVPLINPDEIYVARYNLEHNATDRGAAPNLRLRAQKGVSIYQHQWLFANVPTGGTGFDDAEINPYTPASGEAKNYTMYWSPNSWAPEYDDLNIQIAGEVIEARNYLMYFDVIDIGATQAGTWRMNFMEVGAVDRPPTQTADVEITDLTAGGPFTRTSEFNPANNSVTLDEDAPANGMITFEDPGVDLTPPGADPPNFLLLNYADVVSWDNTVYRVTTRLSCPTATDRANFHRFRIRNFTTIAQIVHEFWINQNLKGINPARPTGNPAMPVVSDGDPDVYTPYEQYVMGFGGATATLENVFGSDWSSWNLGLDQICYPQTGSGGQEELATNTSVHAVLYETLGPPAF